MALAQFEGTLVLVSHDRHLLRATTDQFIIVADGKLQPFDGDLDDYRDWLFKTKLGAGAAAPNELDAPAATVRPPEPGKSATTRAAPPATDRRLEKRREAEERQRRSAAKKPIESRLKRLDEQMAKLNTRKAAIDGQLADQSIYGEAKKDALRTLLVDQAYVVRELSQLETEWLEFNEQLEQLEAAT